MLLALISIIGYLMTILSTVVPASMTPIVDFCLKEAEDETTAESTSKTSCAMVLQVKWHSCSERNRHCSNSFAASAASIGAPAAAAMMSHWRAFCQLVCFLVPRIETPNRGP